METIQLFLNYLINIDTFLIDFVSTYGTLTYVLLFAIVFCETGFVITPFLPGDSLLFAAGSLAATKGQILNIQLLFTLLVIASALGNKINYLIGRYLGPRLFFAEKNWLLNKNHLEKTKIFYEKHGRKTIFIARFIPILRTFAPFVAGMGTMRISTFSVYNLLSAVCWVGSLLASGYFFGSLPFVQAHFTSILYGIIIISLLPPMLTFCYQKFGVFLK